MIQQTAKAICFYNIFGYYWLYSNTKGYFMENELINKAISIVGNQQKLADACNVKQPTVWAWLHGKKNRLLPAQNVLN